ncbi:hypothetical protein DNU06_00545 [Putridiphycobacter roseus]|uniref:Secretion system C-terminal sorting domain-containing protein n=1 Tax=Putridiphycobacter roseus TaxID=2219161 RepID=A0A2W1N249_9FLAO|nr:T9SS type A sorting domain-containing protein [Putridiphycobacter roseus]PZE18357.1 hypothetical protein DNU06_00545 [Putridiphycobacter roseus]
MKSKKILLGTIGASFVAASLFLMASTGKSGVYESREIVSSQAEQGIHGAFEYYQMLLKNYDTGVVSPEDYKRAKLEVKAMSNSGQRANIGFKDHGPDNVGGRTRAILIDKDNDKLIYAGSVSGGLFKSTNRGNVWKKVEGYDVNYGISSMCQTENGNIYVGTGHSEEGFGGNQNSGMNGGGVFFSNDAGLTFSLIAGTENYSFVNEVVSKGNDVFIACSDGLIKYSGSTLTDAAPSINGVCSALSFSNDGTVAVGSFSSNRTYVSEDGGSTWTSVWGNGSTEVPGGKSRVEYAISHEKVDGKYYVFASMSSGGSLAGVYMSKNNGIIWEEIAPANTQAPGSFSPFNSGGQGQGEYDQIISVVKGDPTTCLLGGINVWGKEMTGSWEERSGGFFGATSELYVHSDQHEMKWDSQGRLWLGNDGGIFYSDDQGNSFREANRGYNVTQFYAISSSAHGDVMGGAQDNGTQANYHDNHTYQEHDRVNGGDGFSCAMSFMNRDVIFSTIYYGAVYRSGDRGFNTSAYSASNIPAAFGTPGDLSNSLGSFYTKIELYENPNDVNSKDTIRYSPVENLSVGEVIEVPSETSQQSITYTVTEQITFQDSLYANSALTIEDTIVYETSGLILNTVNLYGTTYSQYYATGVSGVSIGDTLLVDGVLVGVDSMKVANHYFGTNPGEPGEIVDMGLYDFLENISWDTIVITDPYQSWLAFGLGSGEGLWLTRNALRFSASHDGFIQAGGGISGQVNQMEFSKDGNHLYVGTTSGFLYRLSGLNDVYSPNPVLGTADGNIEDSLINWNHPNTQTTFELIGSFTVPITGISVDKVDPDLVMISLGGFGGTGKVRKSINATGASPTFTSISGNIPSMPCLSVLMDRNDPNIIFVGTEFGLFRSENGGGSYEFCDAEFGTTPIFDIIQNWRTWDEGDRKPGQIFIGTHGRGIWTTDEYLAVPDTKDNTDITKSVLGLKLYPNPVVNNATISFEANLAGKGSVKVYSLTGKLVLNLEQISLNEGNNTLQIGTDQLAKGTYLVRLLVNDQVETTKFVKQ